MEQKNSENQTNRRFVILKRVAKHGRQAVIVVPAMLKDKLKPGTLLQLTMDVLESKEEKDD
jgi:hypothetical protein